MDTPPTSPVYAVVYTQSALQSPRNLFHSLKEASKFAGSPEGKANGARFQKFCSAEEANSFLSSGDFPLSPLASQSTRTIANEPSIPSPSLKITELTALKKTIEKDDVDRFCELVENNPRYLINTNADTATILMEGMRYNALHIAARNDKPRIVSKILFYLNDVNFVLKCFGTSEDDALFRKQKIVDMILNNVDKGQGDTPLHMAAKLGHVEVVKALIAEPLLNKNILNKEGLTALQVVCTRCDNDKNYRKNTIQLLLNGYYVALYRTGDNSEAPKIFTTEGTPEKKLSHDSLSSPLQIGYNLVAYAGPFNNKNLADDFLQKWNSTGKEVKRADSDKGYERIGRELANNTNPTVEWMESWFFLADGKPVSFTDSKDLSLLNTYLGHARSGETGHDPLRKKLDFNEDDDGISDDDFEDAVESTSMNDSIGDLAEIMSELTLNSPRIISIKRESSEEDEFVTPPTTPPPIYVMGLPTKSDIDLYLALSAVPQEVLEPYSHIRFFTNKISQVCQKTKPDWPSKDSPRACRNTVSHLRKI